MYRVFTKYCGEPLTISEPIEDKDEALRRGLAEATRMNNCVPFDFGHQYSPHADEGDVFHLFTVPEHEGDGKDWHTYLDKLQKDNEAGYCMWCDWNVIAAWDVVGLAAYVRVVDCD